MSSKKKTFTIELEDDECAVSIKWNRYSGNYSGIVYGDKVPYSTLKHVVSICVDGFKKLIKSGNVIDGEEETEKKREDGSPSWLD